MKPAHFQIIHYVPNLFVGGRVPIGALVLGVDERPRIVRAEYFPDDRCLGGRQHLSTLHRVLDRLEKDPRTTDVAALGPHVQFDSPRALPSHDCSPDDWLREHVLPRSGMREGARGPRRSTRGYQWLEEHGVAPWVRKRFKPGKGGAPDVPELRYKALKSISHWATDGSRLLLLEPIIPHEINQASIEDIATTLGAYRFLLAGDPRVTLGVYMLEGGTARARTWTRSALSDTAHEVIDTTAEAESAHLIAQIRALSESPITLH